MPEQQEETAPSGTAEGLGIEDPEAAGQSAADSPKFRFSFADEEVAEEQVREWRDAGLRQSDYTKKTQALADRERELEAADRLLQSLRANPAETMAYLAEETGWSPVDTQAELDALDPVEKLERQIAGLREEQQQQAQAVQIQRQIATLHKEHGDFDDDALFEHAVKYEIRRLDVALEHMKALEAGSARKADLAKIEAAKRKAPPVEGGTGSGGAVTRGNVREGAPRSIREALAESLREAGLTEMPPIDY